MKRLFTLAVMAICAMHALALEVGNLRTMSYSNPVGIDINTPTFSWVLESDSRGVKQESYSIRVATDSDFQNIVWESGTVESSQSVDVEATGFTANARMRYYWQVTVTDNKGNSATSAEKAYFETGLKNTGWGATQWIKATTTPINAEELGYDAGEYELSFKFEVEQQAAGIIFAAKDQGNYYMWQFNVSESRPRFRPHVWAGGNPSCLQDVYLDGRLERGKEYTCRIIVSNNGSKAITYLDDQKIDERNGNFTMGKLGMRADYDYNIDEKAYFDDIKVESKGTTVYSNDFSNADAPGFSNVTVVNGRAHIVGRGTYAWQTETANYDVETDITILNHNASLVFSAKGSNTYCMWAINTYNVSTPVLRRHIYNNSNDPQFSDVTLPFSKSDILNKQHRLKVQVRGTEVKTFIDDVLVDTYTDKSGVVGRGDVGYRVCNADALDEKAYFDNLIVREQQENGEWTVRVTEDFEGTSNIFDGADVVNVDGNNMVYMYARVNSVKRLMQSEGAILKTDGTPRFRNTFTLGKEVAKARLYSSALGNYNVFINGERVGIINEDGTTLYDELKPGWTDYAKKVFYLTHDVTPLLKQGANAIGAEVTSGWWNGGIAHGQYGNPELGFRCLLVVTYTDGSTEEFCTTTDWQCSNDGMLRRADIYNGESYDARRNDAWSTADYDAHSWNTTAVNTDFKGTISAFEGPAVHLVKELERAPEVTHIYEGTDQTGSTYGALHEVQTINGDAAVELKRGQTVIYDLGQNIAGWPEFTINATAGTKLRFRFAETCNDSGEASRGNDGPAGSLYLVNLRSAEATLYYTAAGNENETFHPRASFYGFRFIEVTASADMKIEKIRGQVLTSVIGERSSLTTSDEMVNKLFSNIQWGQRANFISVPTDCPQRDERLGWTADTQIYSLAGMYNADTQMFYSKWMGDMRDSQRSDGAYPHVAPFTWNVGYGSHAWADAGVILPWNLYVMYGDKRVIEENITSMEKYMSWIASQSTFDGWSYNGPTDFYGDWVAFVNTDKRYISVCYYAYDAMIMSKMEAALSAKENDRYDRKAKSYTTLFNNIKKEFQTRYLNTDGTPKVRTQCAYLLALKFGLLPDDEAVEKTKKLLANNITNNEERLNTGFIGTGILNQTLSEYGMHDKAYNLLLQRNCPSWLYSIDQGATTIWERWNSYTKESGYGDAGMNSFNHYAYGAVGEWMFRYMAGIAPDEQNPGFNHFFLNPCVDKRETLPAGQPRITNVAADFYSNYGSIKAAWSCQGGDEMTYNVTVPANTTATLVMPVADGYELLESGAGLDSAVGVEYVGRENGKVVCNLCSGSYRFSVEVNSGISTAQTFNGQGESNVYTLSGMQVSNTANLGHGVYITAGKKIVK